MVDAHPEFAQIHEEVKRLTGSDEAARVITYFCAFQQHFPTTEEFARTMDYLEARQNYPPQQVDCFRIAGVSQ